MANSSVHLNEEGGAVFRAPFGGFFHLVQYGRHEGLAAEARHYGHDQQQVNFRQVRIYGFKGCGRVESQAVFYSGFPESPECVANVVGVSQFHVKADEVHSCPDEAVKVVVRPFYHQVGIQKAVRPHRFSDGGADFRAKGDVVHKVAVHDVQMQPVGTGVKGPPRFLPNAGEISGQQGRGDYGHG